MFVEVIVCYISVVFLRHSVEQVSHDKTRQHALIFPTS